MRSEQNRQLQFFYLLSSKNKLSKNYAKNKRKKINLFIALLSAVVHVHIMKLDSCAIKLKLEQSDRSISQLSQFTAVPSFWCFSNV